MNPWPRAGGFLYTGSVMTTPTEQNREANATATGLACRELRYPVGTDRCARISLTVAPGEVLQVAGPSGSGKTTLLRVLARLQARLSGELTLDGLPAEEVPPRRWRRRVGYLPQRPTAFEGTVADNLRIPFDLTVSGESYDTERAAGLLADAGLAPGYYLERDARTLSGGELQRLALVRSLLTEPRVLLADEPTASVDAATAAALARSLAGWVERGGSLILVVHDEGPWAVLERRVLDITDAVFSRREAPCP